MSDNLDLDPAVRAAAHNVVTGSASEPGSERFRNMMLTAITNTGQQVPDDTVDAIVEAVLAGTFNQYG